MTHFQPLSRRVERLSTLHSRGGAAPRDHGVLTSHGPLEAAHRIAQAADEFGINPKTLETWHHRGEITRIGTAPKDRARPGRRAGLYDRAQIEAAVTARTADERRFDTAEATAGNGTSPRSSAQPAGLPGIRGARHIPPPTRWCRWHSAAVDPDTPAQPGQHEQQRASRPGRLKVRRNPRTVAGRVP